MRFEYRWIVAAGAALLAACGSGATSTPAPRGTEMQASGSRQPWEQPVPKAVCGANDVPEAGLQGQVPITERLIGFEGYRCNLELVGQVQGEGAGWQHAWFEDCSYYGTANGDGQVNPGVVVVDASDSSNPRITAHLDSQGMLDPWESLKVNAPRKLLADIDGAGGDGSSFLDIYDLSEGCAEPKLLSSAAVPGSTMAGHAGNFAPDGMTYYGSSLPELHAFDISDPRKPVQITEGLENLPVGSHDLSASSDGNRLYLASLGLGIDGSNNGLAILDTSEIQQRKPGAKAKLISETYWPDGAGAQMTQRFSIGGKPYLLFVDEGISTATKHFFCSEGLPPFAFARIFDISDEKAPQLVSKLMLETHDPANCAMTLNDSQSAVFGYDSHYCTAFAESGEDTHVDPVEDAALVICGYFESGLRVFDVRDPYLPREIAYYNPPAQLDKQNSLPGSNHIGVKNVDWTASHPRLRADRGEIWFTSQDNGFQIVKFTNDVWPLKPLDQTPPSAQNVAPPQPARFGGAFAAQLLLLVLLGRGLACRRKQG